MSKYNDTRFFWLQLKEDFFDEDAISWLEEQPNGKEYCLFYLKLCLKSLKTSGIMIRKVGEMLVPYDCKKLAEITNTEVDTVVVAMELLKQIGLIKVLDNGELYLTEVEKMIGSQSVGAFKKQQQRIQVRQVADICPPNIEIELEKELDIDKKKKVKKTFIPPTLEEIKEYAKERKSCVDCQRFYDFFTEGNWVDSKGNKVKNWKQKFITWENHFNGNTQQNKNFTGRTYEKSEISKLFQSIDDIDI